MGCPESKNEIGKDDKIFSYESVQKLISQYQNKDIDKKMFTLLLFSKLDQNPHPYLGRLFISNTYILEQFFLVLANKNAEAKLKPAKIKEQIAKLYKNPQKAIQYSFRIIDIDDDKRISKAQFLCFIDHCLMSLQFAAEKKIQNQEFASNFKNWTKSNKRVFLQNVLKVFEQYRKSSADFWAMGDFVRWIKDQNHWSLDIEIGGLKFRTPINLLCLFNIEI